MSKYDVIIAGSGLGGLVCGYILAKNGFKIAIVEKNPQIGGCLQTFNRFGVKFDTGMHYIGSMDEGQILYRFFKYLRLLDTVKLSRLDVSGFDVISLCGEKFRYANGFEQFTETLTTKFPNNHLEIKNYVKKIQDIANASPLYNLQEINTHVFIDADYIKKSINESIATITNNEKLQNVLVGNLPLYAGIKDKTPIYIHALINNFYIQSAFRIAGGSDTIANSLANTIRGYGGDIFTNAEVKEFICNDKKVVSILLENGEQFEAKYFISNIHPQLTNEKINTKLIRKVYRERIANLENTMANFTVFLKFKPDTVKYLNYNYYGYDKKDIWSINNYNEKNGPESYFYMHQCTKDGNKFADSAQIIAYMRYEEVKKWENSKVQKRGDEYKAFKEEKAQQLIEKLENDFPGTKKSIENYCTSTPLTYRDYTGTKEGSMYGIVRDKNFPAQTLVSQRTKIPNLFLTGQNINSHGILGVTIGAIITCSELLDLNKIIREIGYSN